MLSFNQHPNAETVAFKLLKYSKINIDPAIIAAEMELHPEYPSLLAISDVLISLGIPNNAFRIEADKINSVICPFIAYVQSNGGEFWVVTEINRNYFSVSNEKWEKHQLETETFKKFFGGIVLTIDPGSTSVNAGILTKFSSVFKNWLLTAGFLLVLASALIFHSDYLSNFSWQLLTLTLIKSAGLTTSILLLIQSIDSNNPLIQKLCQSEGKTDCNTILSSKAAKIFNWLSWSEVGFFYFSGTFFLLLFGDYSPAVWLILVILNVVSLPYTFYSIYYQAKIARQWCILCCTVQALLWLEFVPLIISAFKQPLALPGLQVLSAVFISFLIPVILWAVLKPLLLKLQELRPLKQQLSLFKYNHDLFSRLLTAQPQYAPPDKEWSIVLGNEEASNIITLVTNPYCSACAITHKKLDDLLNQNNNIQARIVFIEPTTDDDLKTTVIHHLMALNENADKSHVKQALHDWYGQKQKNYNDWAKVYPVQLNTANFYKLDKNYEWCQVAEVTATPTILLNGYRLPPMYQLTDLKYMLQ
jgi:uncharacterized membrane protein